MKETTDQTNTNTETTTGVVTTVKGFRSTTEVSDFYRFVHDNNLRDEARAIVDLVLKKITPIKKRGRKKTIQ